MEEMDQEMTLALTIVGHDHVPWTDAPDIISQAGVYLGRDEMQLGAFQVGVARTSQRVTRALLDDLYRSRAERAPMGFMVALAAADGVTLYYPSKEFPAPMGPIPAAQAERQLTRILEAPNSLTAHEEARRLQQVLSSEGADGCVNHFLFASYYLRNDVPRRSDWAEAGERALPLLSRRGQDLIAGLGYSLEAAGAERVHVLRVGEGHRRAVAVLLRDDEDFNRKSLTYQLTPVAKALEVAGREGVPWVIALRNSTVRLYSGRDGVGVGQRGQSETYFEIDLDVLPEDQAGLLHLIFSADALRDGGTAEEILAGSGKYAADLGTRLRDRVYEGVIPTLALGIASRLPELGLEVNAESLQRAYHLTMRVLFRLLFQAYGEATGLLPVDRNEHYQANSLQAFVLRETNTPVDDFSTESSAIWSDLNQVWDVIFNGNSRWEVPAYGGALFDPATAEGEALTRLRLPDSVMGPVLQNLLTEDTVDGNRGPVDFRSLQVREFGTIYEGLLESNLSLAEQDLTLDRAGAYVPAKPGDAVVAAAGTPYFHSASGERKATGSYYTPKLVVDHLVERSVQPALEGHLAKVKALLDAGKEQAAADLFFDFRVADLAMGSAHFLVAAVDKIERGMRDFLTEHDVPGVRAELSRLAEKAREALGRDTAAAQTLNDGQLLRRQVARRCVYGLDINPLAVELAQLALWIHTFVPGLPMSSLEHGLVRANSLTGIGTIDEAITALNADGLFEPLIRGPLDAAREVLVNFARASEADKAEVAAGAAMLERARQAAAPAKAIFDVAVARRLGVPVEDAWDDDTFLRLATSTEVRDAVDPLAPAHMPYLFPEVFLRANPGFDAVVGNPPWEEVMVEEPKFWLRIRPGLLGLKPGELKAEINRLRQERADLLPLLTTEIRAVDLLRKTLLAGPYPGLGTGDVDLYQAFAWRNWQLLREQGWLSFVTPRTLMNSAGMAEWRSSVLSVSRCEVVTLTNSGNWVFDNVDGRYSFALTSLERGGEEAGTLYLAGPFYRADEFLERRAAMGALSSQALARASTSFSVPNLPDALSVEVFARMREAPRLDERRPGWDFRPVREFDATNDRPVFDAGGFAEGRFPVRGGAGFDLWTPETDEIYAWADPDVVIQALQEKRQRQVRLKSSAFFGKPQAWAADAETLPMMHPRIAFRDVTNATNSRTVIVALVPPGTVLTNKAPYLFPMIPSAQAEAYLLGILASIPLDWYARKFVELGLNFHILNSLPVPRYDPSGVLTRRLTEISGRLAAVDNRYAAWANDVGVETGVIAGHDREALIAEIDALVSLLYGLEIQHIQHIFRTFHRGWDSSARLERVLHYYEQWKDAA